MTVDDEVKKGSSCGEMPEEEIDEALAESFPASDPPSLDSWPRRSLQGGATKPVRIGKEAGSVRVKAKSGSLKCPIAFVQR